MKLMLLFLILLSVSSCSGYRTFQPWTTQEIAVEGAYLVSSYIDNTQTKNIDNEDGRELNPQLGEHPSDQEVDEYFISTRLLHFSFAYFLDHEERMQFQMFTLGMSVATIYWNFRMGF